MRAGRLTALVPLVLLLAACGGTQGAGTGASGLVPAGVPVYVSLDTNPSSSQWKTALAVAKRFPDETKGAHQLEQSFRHDTGIDWETELKPALGDEVDIVWLDLKGGGNHFVALTQPRDEKKFDEFARKATAKDPSNPMLHVKFKGWEVVSDKQANIDRFKRESANAASTLADDGAFGHAMDTLGSDSLARAFVDGTTIMNLVRQQAGPSNRGFIQKVGTLDWIAMRLGAKSDGLGLDTIVHGTPGQLFKGISRGGSFSPSLTNSVPQDALAYWTFHGSTSILSSLRANPVLAAPQLHRFSAVLGQVGRVLQGENALYVRPPQSGRLPEVTFVASPGHGVDGAAVLDRLLARFRHDTGVTPRRTSIAGTNARMLGAGPVSLAYANVGGKLVVTDLPQGLQGAKSPGTPLAQSDEFKGAEQSSGMPDRTQGFLYVNIHSTIPTVERLAHVKLPGDIARNLRPLRSAVEYAVSRSHEVEVSLFLRIK